MSSLIGEAFPIQESEAIDDGDKRMKKCWNRGTDERGAIIIEATLSLSIFLFAIVSLLMIINLCVAQARIGMTINGVAEDISKFSYIYEMTGLRDNQAKQFESSQEAETAVLDLSEAIKTLNFSDMASELNKMASSETILDSFWDMLKNRGTNYVSSLAMSKVCKEVAKDRLAFSYSGDGDSEANADAYLKQLGVKNGLSGLDFSESVFCPNGQDDIVVVVNYEVEAGKLLGIDFSYHFTQCAATKTWKSSTE